MPKTKKDYRVIAPHGIGVIAYRETLREAKEVIKGLRKMFLEKKGRDIDDEFVITTPSDIQINVTAKGLITSISTVVDKNK